MPSQRLAVLRYCVFDEQLSSRALAWRGNSYSAQENPPAFVVRTQRRAALANRLLPRPAVRLRRSSSKRGTGPPSPSRVPPGRAPAPSFAKQALKAEELSTTYRAVPKEPEPIELGRSAPLKWASSWLFSHDRDEIR